jgi:hypothetical protein
VNKSVVVIGASNMRRLVPILQANGFAVSDLSSPGWLATEENVSTLIRTMSTTTLPPGSFVIMELFGNTVFRFEQFDGSLSLPFKDGTGYHMGGAITTVDENIFKKLIHLLGEVLMSAQSYIKIIIPPLPRYLFHRCCNRTGHSTNVGNDSHSMDLLSRTYKLEELLKTELTTLGVENFWVLNGVGGLLGLPLTDNKIPIEEILLDLKGVFHTDGVHYTESTYRNLTKSAVDATLFALKGAQNQVAVDNSVIQPPRSTYSWRGFTSPMGIRLPPSAYPTAHPSPPTSNLGRKYAAKQAGKPATHHHPYRKN